MQQSIHQQLRKNIRSSKMKWKDETHKMITARLPYVKGNNENIQKLFGSYNTRTIYRRTQHFANISFE